MLSLFPGRFDSDSTIGRVLVAVSPESAEEFLKYIVQIIVAIIANKLATAINQVKLTTSR